MEPSIQGAASGGSAPGPTRGRELATFLVATFIVIPGLAVAFVGGYGFVVWALQMIFGPPGPPG
ncbi:MAG: nitrate reductase [Rhodospirillales bacterium]|nr:nitrate reductase [Rhodospirillales bacterium]